MLRQLRDKFREMFDCDEVRISRPLGRMFLILGSRRSTSEDEGQWYRNGEPVDWDYLAEKVVASGDTEEELIASAEEYKRVLEGGWRYVFDRHGIPWTPQMEAADSNRRAATA